MQHRAYKAELKRSLTLGDLLIYGIIFMVPIAPFGIFGYVTSSSRGMAPLVYLIGMTGMLFTALSYARLAEVFPVAGSVYSYAQRGINEHIGFIAGWLILLDYMMIPPLLYLVSATALHTMIPILPKVSWVIVFVIINTVINILGIEITAKANKVIVALEIIVLVIFLLVGFTAVNLHINGAHFSLKPFFNPEEFDLSMLMSAASIAVISFLGFDSISTLTEEVKDDRTSAGKIVGKAVILTIPIIGSLFIIQTWLASLIVPDYTSFQDLDGAFYEIAQIAGGKWLAGLSIVATALAWGIANALVAQAAISRILFSMARDHKLPAILALIHPKYKTPYVSTLLVSLITLTIIVAGIEISDLASLINFGALSAFLILHVTVINHFIVRKKSRDYFNHLLLPVIGFSIIGYVWMNLGFLAKELGFVWISIGLFYMIIMKLLGKKGFKSEDY